MFYSIGRNVDQNREMRLAGVYMLQTRAHQHGTENDGQRAGKSPEAWLAVLPGINAPLEILRTASHTAFA